MSKLKKKVVELEITTDLPNRVFKKGRLILIVLLVDNSEVEIHPDQVSVKTVQTAEKSSCNDNEMVSCRGSRFGMILEPLMESHGEALQTLCVEGSPARTLASPVQTKKTDRGLMESDLVCGEKWQEWFAKLDPDTSLWKIRQCSLFGDSGQSLETWPRWGTMQNGVCWEQAILAHYMRENDYGFSLPTPLKSDGSTIQMKCKVKHLRKSTFGSRVHSMPFWMLKNHNTRLSPRMSEWVMGWPLGWTDLQRLETDKFRQWQQAHGEF